MRTRLHSRTTVPARPSSTSVQTAFRQRPFAVKTDPATVTNYKQQTPDLQTQLDRASQFGHNFGRVNVYATTPEMIQSKSSEQKKENKLGTSIQLSGSVGKNGKNLPADVEQVQSRLNLLDFDAGEVDGKYGSKTVGAILDFQQVFLKNSDGLIEVGGLSHRKLNQLQGPTEAKTLTTSSTQDAPDKTSEDKTQSNIAPRFAVKRSQDFVQSLDGKSVDSKLLQNIEALGRYLIINNYVSGDIVLGEGMRDAKKAHRWSTSYSIRNDKVPLKALQALPDGYDVDGNQWYLEGETLAQAKRRAAAFGLSSPSTVAAEGYPTGDPRRTPNTWERGISNHLLGKAIDVTIPWATENNGQQNDPVANELVKKFDLKRPVPKERWHFELLQSSEQSDEEHGQAKD